MSRLRVRVLTPELRVVVPDRPRGDQAELPWAAEFKPEYMGAVA